MHRKAKFVTGALILGLLFGGVLWLLWHFASDSWLGSAVVMGVALSIGYSVIGAFDKETSQPKRRAEP